MKNSATTKTKKICITAAVAALYVAFTLVARMLGLDSGVIQLRISEMLCVLPIFMPISIIGLTAGCFLSNLLLSGNWLDILIGPLATLIGALGTYALRRWKWIAPMPAVISNAVIIPFVLAYGYGMEETIPFMMLTVGIGELLSVYGFGSYLIAKGDRIFKGLQN